MIENSGIAIYPLVFDTDTDYTYNIAHGKSESESTLAHELLHLLTNAKHGQDSSDKFNLINAPSVADDVKLTRRLNIVQERKIHADTHVEECAR